MDPSWELFAICCQATNTAISANAVEHLSCKLSATFGAIFFGGEGFRSKKFSYLQWRYQGTKTYISCMDTAYVRENPTPKIAGYKVQETLHFRYQNLVPRKVLISWELKGPTYFQMPPCFQQIRPRIRGLFRDNDGLHNPFIRPAISWKGAVRGGIGGVGRAH